MNLAIVGWRGFNDYTKFCEIIRKLDIVLTDIKLIVSGGAEGTDTLAAKFAKENNIEMLELKPNWKVNGVYNKYAGLERNKDIIEKADIVIAFDSSEARGTKNSIKHAKNMNKKLYIITLN
jgi:hypothetical protein